MEHWIDLIDYIVGLIALIAATWLSIRGKHEQVSFWMGVAIINTIRLHGA